MSKIVDKASSPGPFSTPRGDGEGEKEVISYSPSPLAERGLGGEAVNIKINFFKKGV
jgi:hypothetical protein